MSDNRPNIILLMTDQQRWDTLGCYGNTFVRTPNLDRMAAGGVRFENCFTPWSLCTPARASMWTGVLPHEHKITYNIYGVDDIIAEKYPNEQTLFSLLQKNGYDTGYIGKWHLGDCEPDYFDHWDGYNSMEPHWRDGKIGGEYVPDTQTDTFINYLKERKNSNRPFCVVNSYYPPHDMVYPPYEMFTAPEEFYEGYRNAGVPFPGYYASISNIDYNVGRIMSALEECELKNTIVIFFSDHGENFRSRNPGHKASCTDDSIRVPLIVYSPDNVSGGRVIDGLTGLEDLMPTILELAKIPQPKHLHGDSFAGSLTGNSENSKREYYYIENIDFNNNMPQRAIRADKWKLIVNQWDLTVKDYYTGNSLYDLSRDPEENINLYYDAEHTNTVLELIHMLRSRSIKLKDQLGCDLADNALLETGKLQERAVKGVEDNG